MNYQVVCAVTDDEHKYWPARRIFPACDHADALHVLALLTEAAPSHRHWIEVVQ